MIKSYNWDPEPAQKDEKSKSKFFQSKVEDRTIITVNKDGYVYTYKNELFKKMKINPKEIFIKEEKTSTEITKTEKSDEKVNTEEKKVPKKILKKKDKDQKSKRKTVTFSNK